MLRRSPEASQELRPLNGNRGMKSNVIWLQHNKQTITNQWGYDGCNLLYLFNLVINYNLRSPRCRSYRHSASNQSRNSSPPNGDPQLRNYKSVTAICLLTQPITHSVTYPVTPAHRIRNVRVRDPRFIVLLVA